MVFLAPKTLLYPLSIYTMSDFQDMCTLSWCGEGWLWKLHATWSSHLAYSTTATKLHVVTTASSSTTTSKRKNSHSIGCQSVVVSLQPCLCPQSCRTHSLCPLLRMPPSRAMPPSKPLSWQATPLVWIAAGAVGSLLVLRRWGETVGSSVSHMWWRPGLCPCERSWTTSLTGGCLVSWRCCALLHGWFCIYLSFKSRMWIRLSVHLHCTFCWNHASVTFSVICRRSSCVCF